MFALPGGNLEFEIGDPHARHRLRELRIGDRVRRMFAVIVLHEAPGVVIEAHEFHFLGHARRFEKRLHDPGGGIDGLVIVPRLVRLTGFGSIEAPGGEERAGQQQARRHHHDP